MFRIAILLGMMALGLAGLARADEGKKDEKKEVKTAVVPFEILKSGHMAVDVKVNGKGPFKLIFDTGAPITLVNNKLAREAGVLDGKEKPAFSLFGAMGEAKLEAMELGEAKTGNVSVVVMDHPTVEAISQALKTPIHGLVGFPFFAQFRMTLDYKAKTMTLTPNGFKAPDVMREMQAIMMQAFTQAKLTRTLAPSAQWGVVCSKEQGDEDDGVDVKGVVPGSAADRGGLKRGDRLLTLDGRWTDTMADLYEAAGAVKAGTAVKVKVKRDGKEVELQVTPAKGM